MQTTTSTTHSMLLTEPKYGRYSASFVNPMVSPEARSTTLKLCRAQQAPKGFLKLDMKP